jgi:hypothetical protein
MERAMAAAWEADLAWLHSPDRERGGSWGAVPEPQLRRLLEAAAPLIAAAQPPGPVLQGFERDLTEAEYEALAEHFGEAQRSGQITVLTDDTDERIAEAVAAERERCAQLLEAEAENASFPDGSAGDMLIRAFTGCDPQTIVRAFRGAAGLLRNPTEGTPDG